MQGPSEYMQGHSKYVHGTSESAQVRLSFLGSFGRGPLGTLGPLGPLALGPFQILVVSAPSCVGAFILKASLSSRSSSTSSSAALVERGRPGKAGLVPRHSRIGAKEKLDR